MPDVASLWLSVIGYTALTFVAALAAFQVIALRNDLEGLAWAVGPRHKLLGYVMAGLLMAIAFLGGLLLTLQSGGLSVLLAMAALLDGILLALLASLFGAALRLWWNRRHRLAIPHLGKLVELGPLEATFYRPAGDDAPYPALCLLPDPTTPGDDLSVLIQALVKEEIAVLAFDWGRLERIDRLTLQGLVAVGVSHLERWPEVDAGRVGLVGVGLGGDLALRDAAMDSEVVAVLAIEPVLSARRPALGIESLRALSWFEARRRAHMWRYSTLPAELDGLAAIPCIAPRPVAVIIGYVGESSELDNLEILRVAESCSLVPTIHSEAMGRAAVWLKEHLT